MGVGLVLCSVLCACGPGHSQVHFVSNERPVGYAASQGVLPREAAHQENPNGTVDLTEDDLIEPARPAADTKPERALVHIHGPKNMVSSGVVLAPRVIATTQRSLRGQAKGITSFGTSHEYRVELASSALTWTKRQVKYAIIPNCDEAELDVALLVLDEPAPPLVTPLDIVSAPSTGGGVQAFGFGRCAGTKAFKERNGSVRSRSSHDVVIDIPLCKGDVGGPVVGGRDGEVFGLISRRDEPEGSPLKTTTIARLDTTWARELITQAMLLSSGAEPAKVQGVTCHE
jgi:hypothetical protein